MFLRLSRSETCTHRRHRPNHTGARFTAVRHLCKINADACKELHQWLHRTHSLSWRCFFCIHTYCLALFARVGTLSPRTPPVQFNAEPFIGSLVFESTCALNGSSCLPEEYIEASAQRAFAQTNCTICEHQKYFLIFFLQQCVSFQNLSSNFKLCSLL